MIVALLRMAKAATIILILKESEQFLYVAPIKLWSVTYAISFSINVKHSQLSKI